jgi:hypothetical protein
MTPAQIVAIAFRLFAIWMAIACIQSLALIPVFDSNFDRGLVIVNVVLYAATAAALWFFPLSIAGTILSKTSAASPAPLTSDGLVRAGIVCSGLLLFGLKLPTLNSALFAMFADNPDPYALNPLPRVRVASALLTIFFALVLVCAPDAVLRFLSKVWRTHEK